MALGANDALGVPSNKGSIYPCRFRVNLPIVPAAALVLSFTTVTENKTNGQIEYVKDGTNGDRFLIKQSGVYTITAILRVSGTTITTAIAKNVPLVYCNTSPVTLASTTGSPIQPAVNILALQLTVTNNTFVPISATVWMDAGEYFQVMTTGAVNASDDTQAVLIEKISG